MLKLNKIIPKGIFPSKKEIEKEISLADNISSFIKEKFGLEVRLVGSIAKKTFVKGKNDMDIFVLFDKSVSKDYLRKMGLRVGKEVAKFVNGKARVHYAEHPYTRIEIKGKFIDVVPAYKIGPNERIISAVDRTPLHTDYVISNLHDPREVIKLKWFMKQVGVYGAEIKTHGFSGYLCELLVIKYRSFERILEEASVWEPPVVICVNDSECNTNELKKKFNWHLIVVDPVDPNRNVASPVSLDSMAKFALAARMALSTGKLPRKGRKKVANPIVVKWDIQEENEEIIWSQLESFGVSIKRQLEMNGFKVNDIHWWTDSKKTAELLVDLDVPTLPPVEKAVGPSAFDYKNSDRFIEKHEKVYIESYKLISQKKRKYKDAKSVIKDAVKASPKHLGKRARILSPGQVKNSRVFKLYTNKMWVW